MLLTLLCLAGLDAIAGPDYSEEKFRYTENEAFGFGETLTYEVGYGSLIGGYGYIKIDKEPAEVFGRKCYAVNFGVKSTPAISRLYYIHDRYKSYIDIDGIFSWRFSQKIHEQKYKKTAWATFDQKNLKAYTKDTTVSILPFEHDVVSAFMYVRTMDLASMPDGHEFKLHNFWEDSTYQINVKIIKRETIDVPAGRFRCIVVQPTIEGGDLFSHDEEIWIWLTDDKRKVPVKVGTKLFFGYVGAELIKYKGVRGKIDAKLD